MKGLKRKSQWASKKIQQGNHSVSAEKGDAFSNENQDNIVLEPNHTGMNQTGGIGAMNLRVIETVELATAGVGNGHRVENLVVESLEDKSDSFDSKNLNTEIGSAHDTNEMIVIPTTVEVIGGRRKENTITSSTTPSEIVSTKEVVGKDATSIKGTMPSIETRWDLAIEFHQ